MATYQDQFLTQTNSITNPGSYTGQGSPSNPIATSGAPVIYPLAPDIPNTQTKSVNTGKAAENFIDSATKTVNGIDLAKQQADLRAAETNKINADEQKLKDELAAKDKLATSLDNAAAAVNNKPTTYDPSQYNLPAGAKIGANGTVVDANGNPLGDASQYQIPSLSGSAVSIDQQKTNAWNTYKTAIQQVTNGTVPLTATEQAQLDSMTASYKKLIDQQALLNKNYEGGMAIAGISSGRSRYAPEIQMGLEKSAMDSGLQKITDITTKMNESVANLKQAIMDKKYDQIRQAYTDYNNYLTDRATAIKDQRDYVDKKAKEASDKVAAKNKIQYERVTKPIQDISMEAAKNGLTDPATLSAISNATTVDEALSLAGDYMQTATGDMGLYLQYKRETQSQGLTPKLFQKWYDDKVAKETALGIKKAYSTAYASAAGKAAAEASTTSDVAPTLDAMSDSILGQTGLSAGAFAYATQGTTALARMSEKSRTKYMEEWRQYQIEHGINGATFRAQYEALNKTVSANVMRNNQAKVAEQELDATIGNIMSAATDADLKKTRLANVAKLFAGQEFNDPALEKYAFHLNQLRNELAMYNAAVAGQIDANGNIREIAKSEMDNIAATTIKNGIAKGGLEGFKAALTASREKMGVVLNQSIAAQDKQVWDLFGVTSPENARGAVNDYISANPGDAENIAKMYEMPGATDANIYKWLKDNNKLQ